MAGCVPQAKEPGAEAEVDFGDVFVELAGRLTRCYLFDFRLSCSGKGCHRVYASCAQEAFLEGHVTAFEATGGVPWRHIRYDNLSPAVAKVLRGRNRAETARWLACRSWYGFSELAGVRANTLLWGVTGCAHASLAVIAVLRSCRASSYWWRSNWNGPNVV